MTEQKKTKVLIVAPDLPLIGGQAIQARRLIKKFEDEENLQVDFQPVNPKFLPRLQKIKILRTIITSIKYVCDLFIRLPKYDVIHIFSASYFSFLLAPTPAVLLSKLFRKKTILNYRSGEAEDHLRRWKRTAIPIIKLADKIVVPSKYLVDIFEKFDLKAKAVFNFVEVDPSFFRRRKELTPVFLSNRNFEDLYNVSCVLRGFGIIQKNYPNARLMVVGDGNEKARLEKLARDLDLKNVEFIGYVPHEKMPEFYKEADIYLNSPNIDNMPNSIIEAFAYGIPVVSTNAGGIPYIVEDGKTGLLVKVNDHRALARKAIELLENEKIARIIISNALEEVYKYTWENVRAEWIGQYEYLVKKT